MKAFFAVGLLWVLSGCNSLFYFPDSRKYFSPKQFAETWEEWRIPFHDSFLSAWHLKAVGKSRGVVIHFHGNAQNMTAHIGFSGWLVASGFDVLTFDYPGYGSSPGMPSQENTVDSGVAVIAEVSKKLPELDLFVLGQSLGGAIAFVSVARSQNTNVRGLVIESSFASYHEMARNKLGSFPVLWFLRDAASLLVTDKAAPINSFGDVKLPLLFFHGDRDPVVPYSEGHRFFTRAKSADKHWVRVENGGHTSAFQIESEINRNKMLQFMCERSSSQITSCE